ncbi:hypothetical protein EVAR_91054_1 [Eumeta japonica]|uniref:Uncharacterized protein n=1 Tax=Eumeta variegata TaxID=151549 RepID=A0A4C1Z3N0_EUMVA|nr:hypothetical protein EVAR_91054_1 [Eumeta japonica]
MFEASRFKYNRKVISGRYKVFSDKQPLITGNRRGGVPVGRIRALITRLPLDCAARGRPIIVEWERDARHSAGLSLVRRLRMCVIMGGAARGVSENAMQVKLGFRERRPHTESSMNVSQAGEAC